MTIIATVNVGREFGNAGKMVTEDKVFTNLVDFDKFMATLRDFDAEDEVVSVKWDCK